jgi:hypothetical protein
VVRKLPEFFAVIIVSVVLAFGLFGCVGASTSGSGGTGSSAKSATSSGAKSSSTATDDGTTDQMFNKDVAGAELYVFQYDGSTYTVDTCYTVDNFGMPLEDGCFYKVVADVRYLNGGVAGYVNYPEIKQVTSCEQVSPFEMGLPSTEDAVYGVTLIGDYADGDVLLYEMGKIAVWKDGSWVYRYKDVIDLPDGSKAAVRTGVSANDVQAGIANGVLCCEDYFVLPQKKQ